MDIMNLAKGMLADKLGANGDAVGDAIGGLLGEGQEMDIGSLMAGFQEKGLGGIASSWLGDGANEEVSVDQLKDVLGEDEVAAAAAKLGTDEGSLLDSLRDALPQIIDKSSSGGSLLDSVGGLGGLGNMAKKFL